MRDRRGAGHKAFLIVAALLLLLLLAAGAAAWWMLDRVQSEMAARREREGSADRRIAEYLPRRGTGAEEKRGEAFHAVLVRRKDAAVTELHVGRDTLGDPNDDAVLLLLQKEAKAWMDAAGAARAADLRGEVSSGPEVPTKEILRVVDALIAAGIKDVTFVGTPPRGSLLEKLQRERK